MSARPKTPPKTPLAVALRYEKPNAPRVVAIGRGEIGQKIIDVAREHGVPLSQNPELAQVLSTVALDDEIPLALYQAVAEVISFVLRHGKGEWAVSTGHCNG